MRILDATCGFKGIWYQKNHPFVTFMDKRTGSFNYSDNHKYALNRDRTYRVNPDIISEWKHAPFPNNHFDMIVFDPPHLIIERGKKPPAMTQAYGYLYKDNWRKVLKDGINKLFNILKPEGVFVFKWCENSAKVQEVLKFFPYKPLFGSNTKSKGHTSNFWILFIKHNVDKNLSEYTEVGIPPTDKSVGILPNEL